MALLDDPLPGGVLAAAATMGAAALFLPRLFPSMAPLLRDAVLGGLKIFVEAEFEAEGGLIETLVGQTVESLIESVAKEPDPAARRKAARVTIKRFERKARARSGHWGRDDADAARRYRRHLRRLKHALQAAEEHRPDLRADVLAPATEAVTEDW